MYIVNHYFASGGAKANSEIFICKNKRHARIVACKAILNCLPAENSWLCARLVYLVSVKKYKRVIRIYNEFFKNNPPDIMEYWNYKIIRIEKVSVSDITEKKLSEHAALLTISL